MSAGTPLLGAILASFFNDHLKLQRGLRPNSITSYADAMRLLLQFAAETGKKKITQLGLDDLDADVVSRFLNSLEESRSNAAQSRNQRLAALRTFFEYVGQRFPERLGQAQKVAAIPRKRAQPPETIFLERDEIEGTLAALPVDGRRSLRDRALLVFLYNTGARAQEAVDLRASDVYFDPTPRVHLHGKGDKWRVCPIWAETSALLKKLIPAVALAVVTGLQVLLGFATFTLLLIGSDNAALLILSVAHVSVGALTMAASVLLAIQVRRNLRRRSSKSTSESNSLQRATRYPQPKSRRR